MKTLVVVSALLLLIPTSNRLAAQGEAAVPVLLIHPSPEANGWGNIATAVVSDNPVATIANPGQLGMFSLDGIVSASMYSPKTKWFPESGIPDLTYDVWAVNGGYDLTRILDLPFRLGIGAGYSRVYLNLGEFTTTNSVSVFNPFEKSEQFSLGFGIDYFLKVGVGWNFKRVVSRAALINNSLVEAKPSATDFGLLVQAPLFDILERAGQEPIYLFEDVQPLFRLTFGYARSNLGDRPVDYGDYTADPLPRNATIGLSAEIGLTTDVNGTAWKMLTFTLAREAEDLLVVRTSGGGYEFQSGLGDISFFRHVVRGKIGDQDRVKLHKGWQLNIGEFIYIRSGSFSESPNFGNRNYTTSGFGIRLSGFFKTIEAVHPAALEDDVLAFIFHHFDFVYDHAEYTHSVFGGTKFNALSVVIR